MSDWQPIETAPRGPLDVYGYGQRILGWDGNTVSVTYWHRPTNGWLCEAEVTCDGHGVWKPTHWQPLPSPPAGE